MLEILAPPGTSSIFWRVSAYLTPRQAPEGTSDPSVSGALWSIPASPDLIFADILHCHSQAQAPRASWIQGAGVTPFPEPISF